jgi:murein DD-endopeptidase MepM/ murein hydrolase activator NlpD
MMRLPPTVLASAALFAAVFAAAKGTSVWDRYLDRADQLKKFRDKGTMKEQDVLKVLREAGVFEKVPSVSKGGGHRSFASGFRAFKVRTYKGLWLWPLRYGIVSSEYGKRWGKRHHGIDIAADEGDPVYASANGEVLYSSNTLRGYGNVVILRHDQKTTTLYAHNKRLLVRKGQRVRTGQKIATVGSTGRSTGPHVHFEIRGSKGPVNPRRVLPKKTRF